MHRAAIWQAARSGLSRRAGRRQPAPRAAPGRRGRPRPGRPAAARSWRSSATGTRSASSPRRVLARGNSADRQRAALRRARRARGRHASSSSTRATVRRAARRRRHAGAAPLPRPGRRRGGRAAAPSRGRPTATSSSACVALGPRRARGRGEAARRLGRRGQGLTLRRRRRAAAVRGRPGAAGARPARVGGARGRADPARLGDRVVPAATSTATQRILADGVLPRDVVLRSPGWRDEATRLPAGAVRAPVMGFDLVRNEYGGWRVLEDNVRYPSGAAYAIAVRGLMDAVMPDLPRPDGLADPAAGATSCCARRCSPTPSRAPARPCSPAARAARPGSSTAAWPSGAGLLLVTADDLDVADGRVVHRTAASRSASSTCGWTTSWSTSTDSRRPADRRGDLRRRRGPAGSSWPTRPATGSPTTRRPTPSCPS